MLAFLPFVVPLWALAMLCLVGSAWIFLCLSILADEYLAASLEDLSHALSVPASVSAATFVAFGSSAPELVISFVGAASDNTELTIPTLLASALLAFGLIPALCVVDAEAATTLDPYALFRDTVSFAVPLLVVALYALQRRTNLWQSLILVGLYALYVFAVYALRRPTEAEAEAAALEAEAGGLATTTTTYGSAAAASSPKKADEENFGDPNDDDDSGDSGDSPPAWRYALEWPIRTACELTVRGGPVQRFATTLAYIGALSYGAVTLAEVFTRCVPISHATAGMTILALGAQVPDLIAAVELARNGHADAGISQAVGSQVINVTVGLGLPFAFYILHAGRDVQTDNNSTILNLTCLVFLMILVYVAVVAASCIKDVAPAITSSSSARSLKAASASPRPAFFPLTTKYKALIDRSLGYVLLAAFVAIYALGIVSAELKWPRSTRSYSS